MKTLLAICAVVTVLACVNVTQAVLFSDPGIPPVGGADIGYLGQGSVEFAGTVAVSMMEPFHTEFTNIVRAALGSDEKETFDSVLHALVDVPAMGAFDMPVTVSGPVEVIVRGYSSGQTGTFQTEIVSMSLTGDVGGTPVELRQSPTLASIGQTTITDVGGGMYDIESFFDVFVELSVDGGNSFVGGSDFKRMVLVPEPATLCLLGLGALSLLRKRRSR